MEDLNIWKEYKLSQHIVEQLKEIKEALKEDIAQADPLWGVIACTQEESEEIDELREDDTDDDNDDKEEENVSDKLSESHDNQFFSTQFYFTQTEKILREETRHDSIQKTDILECIYEELERTNGKLDFSQLENLSDEEVLNVVCDLEKSLSITGTYNLCRSMNGMNLDQRMKYLSIFCTHLLLPKIINLEEPSRLLLSIIVESIEIFPNDIQKLIFIPLLNVDLKDATIATAILDALGSQRYAALIEEYVSSVEELKSWHLPLLQNLLSIKTDHNTNDKLIELFLEKALYFSKDKSFGKLILSFIKVNGNFSQKQKNSLWEITNINETLFKKPIENVLNKI